MPYFKHTESNRFIFREDANVRLIAGWAEVDKETIDLDNKTEETTNSDAVYLDSTTESIADTEDKFELNENIQTFDTVKDLKKDADKAFAAQTKRGSIYDYVDGEWRKADDEN